MAVALRRIRDRVRDKLNLGSFRTPVYNVVQVDQAIASRYIHRANQLPAPWLYTASAFTIAAGGDTFQLPATVTGWTGNDGGAEYRAAIRIQLASTGEFLDHKSPEQIDAMRNGQPTPCLAIPYAFALYEETDQDVQGRCYPGTKDAQVCHLTSKLAPDDLRDYVGSGSGTLSTVEAQLSRLGAEGLVFDTAAELLARLPKRLAEQLGLDKTVAAEWRDVAERMFYREAARRHDVNGKGGIQRWVS